MQWLIFGIVLALGVAMVVAGATGNSGTLLSAITGHSVSFGSSSGTSSTTSTTSSTSSGANTNGLQNVASGLFGQPVT